MGKLYVKNGTPVGNEHLCKSCTWGQFTVGYRESDVLAICTNTNPNIRLPFTVHACSEYADKNKPGWQQMEKLAIEIAPLRVSKKTKGFNVTEMPSPDRPEYEPAAAKDEDDRDYEKVDAVAEAAFAD
jgi:hypothetical protein